MQQATEAMKSSQKAVHNQQGGSDLNRSRRSGQCGFNAAERKSQALKISTQRIDRPIVADMKMPPSIYLQAAAKLNSTGHVLTRSSRLIGLSKPRKTASIPFPPISGSRTISGKLQRIDALPARRLDSAKTKRYSAHLPAGKVMTENTALHVLDTQGRRINQESGNYNKICVAAPGSKAAMHVSESCSRLIKRTFGGQPAETLTSAGDSLIQQKNDASGSGAKDSSTMMPVRAKHDASHCEARQQRDFSSDDSAIETESEGSEEKGRLERLKEDRDDDDEYYTDQRIIEWVLTVNSSFFCEGSDEAKRSKPLEEQDVATIKIVYRGD